MSSGCRILARRWRPRGMNLGELDLVAMDRGEVVFVEVKTRRSDAFGAPEEAATPEKLGKVIRTAQAFLAAHPRLRRLSWRLDVIAVEWRDDRPLLRHYKGVGEAG